MTGSESRRGGSDLRARLSDLLRVVMTHVRLRTALRVGLRSPRYVLRKYLLAPCRTYDVYLLP